MPVRECTVSFIDSRGVRHSTLVHASTVLEAAALALITHRRHLLNQESSRFRA